MDNTTLIKMMEYKSSMNISLPDTATHYNIGINKLRRLLHDANIDIPKKSRKLSSETKEKIRKSNLSSKNSPLISYDWKSEYELFIIEHKKDKSVGIKSFCKDRGYHERYLRKYITDKKLPQPRGVAKRTKEWKEKISKANLGKVNNPKGSNGKLKGKKLKKNHRDKIRAGLVKTHYNISLDEWKKLQGKKEMYYREVWRITNQQPLEKLDNYDKRGNAGINGNYQLDHIYPISKGFMNNMPPEEIARLDNLQMIPWLENRKKGNKVSLA